MNHFSSMPVGTGPYAVVRNNQNQLKIHAFEDYFGYRALIDEVNVWVLPEISEEPNGGLTLQGNTESEKAVESRLEEGCYYLLFDSRSPLGANEAVRRWLSYLFQPANLLYHAGELYRATGFPLTACCRAGITPATTPATSRRARDGYPHLLPRSRRTSGDRRDHARPAGGASGKAGDPELEYDARHRGEVVSDIWLNSVNFTLPIEFSLFAYLYEVPLIQRCIPIDWQEDASRWRAGEFNPATESAPAGQPAYRAADPSLADDSGAAQYARRADEHPRLVRF